MRVEWKGGMAFDGIGENGMSIRMDAHPDHGGADSGISPVEALLASAAACSAMDVISILQKKKQVVSKYWMEVDGERNPPGEWPRPFLSISIKHFIEGENLDEVAVARSVQLSDEKYCTVVSTLRSAPVVTSSYEIL
ncbi:MAG: OsmC family protein [Fimbriimonadaceae bacterium]